MTASVVNGIVSRERSACGRWGGYSSKSYEALKMRTQFDTI